MKLDPWGDAQALAHRLAQPHATLIVLIAASAWCHKCRDYQPLFDHLAAIAPPHETHVWLDLDEHSTFIGPWIPDDLPLQLTYHGGQLTHALAIRSSGPHQPLPLPHPDPGIFQRLCADDWAR